MGLRQLAWAWAAVLVVACGARPPEQTGPIGPPAADGGVGAAADGGTLPDAGTPSEPEAVPGQVALKADDPRVASSGRVDWGDPEGPRFSLPGVSFRVRFVGTGISATLVDRSQDEYPDGSPKQSRYAVYLDGAFLRALDVSEGTATYLLAGDLPLGEHEVELFRESEGWLTEAQLLGFEVLATEVLPAAQPERRVEFVGDSILTGYGATGESERCAFDRDDQSYRASYANVAARLLGADQRAVAASGVGVMKNRDGTDRPLASDIYARILPTRPDTVWSLSTKDGWSADAVVVQLGANDFASRALVETTFQDRYVALLTQLRAFHPRALMVVALDPLLSDHWPKDAQERTRGRAMLQEIVSRRNAAGDARVVFFELAQASDDELGCDWHPDVAKHEALGRDLAAFLRAQLGW